MWPRVRDFLIPAIEGSGGRYDEATVIRLLTNDQAQLWVAYEDGEVHCAWVTSIVEYPCLRALCILFLGGRGRQNWLGVVSECLDSFAREIGARKIELQGRKGWAGDARNFGYSSTTQLFEREIED